MPTRAVDTGFFRVRGFYVSPFSVLRPLTAFDEIVGRAVRRHDAVEKAFADAESPRPLGLPLDMH